METKLITFAEYMEQSLYGPRGYYSSGSAKTGRAGDYFTAPEVSPIFGKLLSRIFCNWRSQFSTEGFDLVETGAGEGHLTQVISEATERGKGTFEGETRFTAVEKSETRRAVLSGVAATLRNPLKIVSELTELEPGSVSGCLFANELIDALPVHRVRFSAGRLTEGYVRPEDGHFEISWQSPSTKHLAAYFERLQTTLPDAYETEVNLAMRDWIASAARVLSRGLIVLIDYGRPALDYYAPERNRGTLRCFSGHHVIDPFRKSAHSAVPEATSLDWTSDVDFTSLALDAREAGLQILGYMDLGSFLMLGADDLLREKSLSQAEAVGLRYLMHPEGMGAQFQVLILGKNLEPAAWKFRGNRLRQLGIRGIEC